MERKGLKQDPYCYYSSPDEQQEMIVECRILNLTSYFYIKLLYLLCMWPCVYITKRRQNYWIDWPECIGNLILHISGTNNTPRHCQECVVSKLFVYRAGGVHGVLRYNIEQH